MHGDEGRAVRLLRSWGIPPRLVPEEKGGEMNDGMALNLLLLWMLIQSLRQ